MNHTRRDFLKKSMIAASVPLLPYTALEAAMGSQQTQADTPYDLLIGKNGSPLLAAMKYVAHFTKAYSHTRKCEIHELHLTVESVEGAKKDVEEFLNAFGDISNRQKLHLHPVDSEFLISVESPTLVSIQEMETHGDRMTVRGLQFVEVYHPEKQILDLGKVV